MKWKPSLERRNVFLAIQPVPMFPASPEQPALLDRIGCISLLIDNSATLAETSIVNDAEPELLDQFWSLVQPTDVFVGHNLLGYGLPLLRQRCWIQGIRPSRQIDLRPQSLQVIDTNRLWSNGGSTPELDLVQLGKILRCRGTQESDAAVADWWEHDYLAHIACHCAEKVRLAYSVFHRMMFLPEPRRFTELPK